MKFLAASILAFACITGIGNASAQSSAYQRGYSPQQVDRYGNAYGAQYDYARVIRVDPIIQSGYGQSGYGVPTSQRRCYSRQDGYYAGDYPNNYPNNQRYGNNGYGGYDGSYDRYGDDGYDNRGYRNTGNEAGRNVATVLGGVIGAAIGSQIGGGSARYATAAVGSMVGGMAGRQVYDSNHRNTGRNGVVTVCDPEPVRNGYYPANDARVTAYNVTYEYAGRQYTTQTNYHPGNTIRVRVDVRPE